MDAIWGEFLAAGFGALLGAGSAVGLGLLLDRRNALHEDRARVSNFLIDMSTRRAFYAAPGSTWTNEVDAARLVSAVQSLRRASREVRLALRHPPGSAMDALIEIIRSCNRYLETVENSEAGATDLVPFHDF